MLVNGDVLVFQEFVPIESQSLDHDHSLLMITMIMILGHYPKVCYTMILVNVHRCLWGRL